MPEGELRAAAQAVYDRDPQALGRGGFAAALMEELNSRLAVADLPPITELSVRDAEVYTNPLDNDAAGSAVTNYEAAPPTSNEAAAPETPPADHDENTSSGDPAPTPLPAYTVLKGDNFWDVAEGDTQAMRTPTMEQIDPAHRQALIDLARDRINADPQLREQLGAFDDSAALLKEGEQLNLHRLDEVFADIAAREGWLDAAAEASPEAVEAAEAYEYTVTADDYDGVVAILEREYPQLFADLDTSERLAVFGALDQQLQADPALLADQLASGDPDVIAAGEKLDLGALVAEAERLVSRAEAGEALGSRAMAVTGEDVTEAVAINRATPAEPTPSAPTAEAPVTYRTPELPLPASGNLYQTPEWQEYVGSKFGSREAFAQRLSERVMSVEAESYPLLEKPGFLSFLADAEPSDQLEHSAYQAIHDRSVGEFLAIFAEGNEAEFDAVLEEAQQLAATDGRTSNVSAETLRAWGEEISNILDTREAGAYYNDRTSVGDLYARYIAETEVGVNRAPADAPTVGERRAEGAEAPEINNRRDLRSATDAEAADFDGEANESHEPVESAETSFDGVLEKVVNLTPDQRAELEAFMDESALHGYSKRMGYTRPYSSDGRDVEIIRYNGPTDIETERKTGWRLPYIVRIRDLELHNVLPSDEVIPLRDAGGTTVINNKLYHFMPEDEERGTRILFGHMYDLHNVAPEERIVVPASPAFDNLTNDDFGTLVRVGEEGIDLQKLLSERPSAGEIEHALSSFGPNEEGVMVYKPEDGDRPTVEVEGAVENKAFSEMFGTVEGLTPTEKREVLDAYRTGSPEEREALANMWLGESEVIPGKYTNPFTATLSRQIGGQRGFEM